MLCLDGATPRPHVRWFRHEAREGNAAEVVQIEVGVLRELFRSLQQFRALFESEGVDEITDPDGRVSYSLWDVEYLWDVCQRQLPPYQQNAIRLCLIENQPGRVVAGILGVSSKNIATDYATEGLEAIVAMVESGRLPRFQPPPFHSRQEVSA